MDLKNIVDDIVRVITLPKRPRHRPEALPAPPNLECVRRVDGLPMQWQGPGSDAAHAADPKVKALDGGDSAHRAGLLAFCGSSDDARVLPRYLLDTGVMVRHPTDPPWNNPWNSTRDQLIGYLAGCWRSGQFDLARALYQTHANRNPPFTCQSRQADEPGTDKLEGVGDLLGPHEIMYFRVCCGDFDAAADLLGNVALYVSMEMADDDPATKGAENTQVLLMAAVCGQLDVFVARNERYKDVQRAYWGSGDEFRHQACVADAVIATTQFELSRYPVVDVLDMLVPHNILDALKGIDVGEALRDLKVVNPLWWLETSMKLTVATLSDVIGYLRTMRSGGAIAGALALEVEGLLLKASRQMVTQVNKFARENLPGASLTVVPILNLAGSILGMLEGNNDNEEEKSFRELVQKELSVLIQKTDTILQKVNEIDTAIANLLPQFERIITSAFRTEVIEVLRSKVAACSISVDVYREHPNDISKEILIDAAGECRELLVRALDFGPGALPYCVHAFSFVLNAFDVLGALDEARGTRAAFSKRAEESYFSPQGLHTRIVALRTKIREAENAFGNLLGPRIICSRSVQRWRKGLIGTVPFLSEPGPGKNGDAGKTFQIWDPANSFDVYVDQATFTGELNDMASLKHVDAVATYEGIRDFAPQSQDQTTWMRPVSPKAVFRVATVVGIATDVGSEPPPRPGADFGKDATGPAVLGHLEEMRRLSKIWIDATAALRDIEALSVSARAVFAF